MVETLSLNVITRQKMALSKSCSQPAMRTIERVGRIENFVEGWFRKTSAASMQPRVTSTTIAKNTNSFLSIPASITYSVQADGTRIYSGLIERYTLGVEWSQMEQ